MISKLLTEVIGTFFLVLTILLSIAATGAGPLAPVAIGAMLIVMVYMGGPVSGAHYNPAVTLGVFIRGKIPLPAAGMYVVAQFLGAALACGVAMVFGYKGGPVPATAAPIAGIWLVEVLFTFALVLVVLNVATVKQTSPNHYYGAAIGLTVMAAAFAGGGISGGVFNPAVGVVPSVLLTGRFDLIPLYIFGPCIGAALAALAFRVQHGNGKD